MLHELHVNFIPISGTVKSPVLRLKHCLVCVVKNKHDRRFNKLDALIRKRNTSIYHVYMDTDIQVSLCKHHTLNQDKANNRYSKVHVNAVGNFWCCLYFCFRLSPQPRTSAPPRRPHWWALPIFWWWRPAKTPRSFSRSPWEPS